MLPCNVIVQELKQGMVEMTGINQVSSMQAVDNDLMGAITKEIMEKLERSVVFLEQGCES
jgi:hypothetical protein